MLAVYGYHAYNYYLNDGSMYIHRPRPELSAAVNLLQMLRPDQQYTPLEAHVYTALAKLEAVTVVKVKCYPTI